LFIVIMMRMTTILTSACHIRSVRFNGLVSVLVTVHFAATLLHDLAAGGAQPLYAAPSHLLCGKASDRRYFAALQQHPAPSTPSLPYPFPDTLPC
jgi:hypothetical protein